MSVSAVPAVQNAPNKLVSNLFSQMQIGKYCDIQLKFGSVVLRAHACVVGCFSAFVDNLVTKGEVMTSMLKKIPVVNVPLDPDNFSCHSCASRVIEFMYLGKIQIDNNHLEHIRAISCGLHILELQRICQKHYEKCAAESNKIEPVNDFPNVWKSSTSNHKQNTQKRPAKAKLKEEFETLFQCSTSVKSAILQGSTKCDVPNNLDTRATESSTLEEKEWAGLICPVCNLTFMSIVKFQQHSSTHLGKIYTTCIVCSYASLRVSDLIKHLQEKDHGERVCSLCLYEASTNISLKEHLQQHDHSQPFFCLTCNTRFQTRTALNSHIVKHSSETPYRCKECGRGFKWKHGLQSHMATHTSVKKLLCDQCGYSTAHLKSFIDHKSVHSGETFKCPVADCKFKSVRKESVKQHLSTHSKEKPYQCEICGQAFSQAKNLRRHAAIHDPGVDPEQCPFCPFQTTRSDKFRDHFRRSHKQGSKDKATPNTSEKSKSRGHKGKNGDTKKSRKTFHGDAGIATSETTTDLNTEPHSTPKLPSKSSCSDCVTNELQPFRPYDQTNGMIINSSVVSGSHGMNGSESQVGVDQIKTIWMGLNNQDVDLQQVTRKEDRSSLKSHTSSHPLLVYNDSISQTTQCTLYLCSGETFLVSDEMAYGTDPQTAILNNQSENVSPESLKSSKLVVCSDDAEESGLLSLACNENLTNLDQDIAGASSVFPVLEVSNNLDIAAVEESQHYADISSTMTGEQEVLVFTSSISDQSLGNSTLVPLKDMIQSDNFLLEDCLKKRRQEITENGVDLMLNIGTLNENIDSPLNKAVDD